MVGFDGKNKYILDLKFICSFCSLILCDPVQLTECGHRQCQSCFESQDGMIIKCPECLTESERNKVMIDRAFERDIQSLPIECSSCKWDGVLNNYQAHVDQFHPNPKCDHCGEQFDSMNKLSEHKVLIRKKTTADCLLTEFGCDEQISRCDISKHYSSEQHENSLRKFLYHIQLQTEKTRQSSTQTNNNLSQTTTVEPVHFNANPIQELCKLFSILPDDANVSSNDEQQRLNNALLQCQIKCPTLTQDFLRVKLSQQESSGCLRRTNS